MSRALTLRWPWTLRGEDVSESRSWPALGLEQWPWGAWWALGERWVSRSVLKQQSKGSENQPVHLGHGAEGSAQVSLPPSSGRAQGVDRLAAPGTSAKGQKGSCRSSSA